MLGEGCRGLGRRLWALNERQQTRLQRVLACLGKIDEAEGLKPTLGRPHGKHHLYLFADGRFPEVKDQLDLELFVERLLHVYEAAGGGKLMQFASQLALVGQSNEGQDRSAELDPKGALSLLPGGQPGQRRTWRDRFRCLRHGEKYGTSPHAARGYERTGRNPALGTAENAAGSLDAILLVAQVFARRYFRPGWASPWPEYKL